MCAWNGWRKGAQPTDEFVTAFAPFLKGSLEMQPSFCPELQQRLLSLPRGTCPKVPLWHHSSHSLQSPSAHCLCRHSQQPSLPGLPPGDVNSIGSLHRNLLSPTWSRRTPSQRTPSHAASVRLRAGAGPKSHCHGSFLRFSQGQSFRVRSELSTGTETHEAGVLSPIPHSVQPM